MVAVPGGSLLFGGRAVTVRPFWIASTETTWEAFDVFTSSGPPSPAYDQTPFAPDAIARPSKSYIPPDRGWGHHGYPAINVSGLSAQMFCRWLAAKTGKKFRLPTEVEWEYACRAGAPESGPNSATELAKSAWFADNSQEKTHPVAKKLPNRWKLYDMLGNAGEWAFDLNGKLILCGGSFADKSRDVRPGGRARQTPAWQETDPQLPKSRWWLADAPFAGFRIVCVP